MKKFTAVLVTLLLTLSMLAGCGNAEAPETTAVPETTAAPETAAPEKTELVVFAAASLKETLTNLGDLWMEQNPGLTVSFNFDSSGTLKTQIEEGARCDVFLSAGQKQMNALQDQGLVAEESRFDILENKVVLSVPEGNPAGLEGFDDLSKRLGEGNIMLALGNSDVPVGQYTLKIFDYYKLDVADMEAKQVLTYCSNVKEVTTQVSEAVVDCGIIYQTDAFSAGLTVLDTAKPEMCGQVIYPAAMIAAAEEPEAAQAFLDFLTGAEANAEFQRVGFTPMAG